MRRENLDDRVTIQAIGDSFTLVDEQRRNDLIHFRRLQEVKNEIGKLEMVRLKKKYPEEYPKIGNLAVRISYNQELIKSLDKEILRANIKPEPLPRNAWRIHGRVFGQDKNPLKGQIVTFSLGRESPNRNLPRSVSDTNGNFSITVEEENNFNLNESDKVYLLVVSRAEQTIYKSKLPFTIKKSLIDFHDIYLEDID